MKKFKYSSKSKIRNSKPINISSKDYTIGEADFSIYDSSKT